MFSSCIDWFNGDYFLSFFLFLVDWASFSFVRSSVLSFIQFFFFYSSWFLLSSSLPPSSMLSKQRQPTTKRRKRKRIIYQTILPCRFLFRFSSKNETKTRQKIFFYLFQCTEIDTSKWLRLRREGITKLREEEAPKELYKQKKTQSAVLQKKNE